MPDHRVVLDSGYALEAIMPTTRESQQDALELIAALADGSVRAVVPWIFYAEIAAGCAKGVRARRLDADDAMEFMQQMPYLGIDIDMRLDGAAQMYSDAMRTGAQAYDAIYLTLAESMDLPVATVDKGMRTAVRSMKLSLYRS